MKKIVKDELIVGKSPRSISEIDIDDQKFLKNPAVIDLGYAVSEKIITCKSFQWFDDFFVFRNIYIPKQSDFRSKRGN